MMPTESTATLSAYVEEFKPAKLGRDIKEEYNISVTGNDSGLALTMVSAASRQPILVRKITMQTPSKPAAAQTFITTEVKVGTTQKRFFLTASLPRSSDEDDVLEIYGEELDSKTAEWINAL